VAMKNKTAAYVFEEYRHWHVTQRREIGFHQIRIVHFTQIIMMTIVVFDIPRFGYHPIEPI
jgi:hypothetical protein